MAMRNLISTFGFSMLVLACGGDSADPVAMAGSTSTGGGGAGSSSGGMPSSGGGGSTSTAGAASGGGGTSAGGAANGGAGASAGGAANGGGGASAGGAAGGDCTSLASTGPMRRLLISEVTPGEGIEVFNPGTMAVNLSDVWFCAQYDYKKAVSPSGKTAVPPGGYVAVSWPEGPGYMITTETDGEIMLFIDPGGIPTVENQQDYVCWGDFGEEDGRKGQEIGGMTLFPGPCAPALTAGSIQRKPMTPGGDAASFDSTAAPSLEDCPM